MNFFLFSMVYVGSTVVFDKDPASGSSQLLIQIRIQGGYGTDSMDQDPQHCL